MTSRFRQRPAVRLHLRRQRRHVVQRRRRAAPLRHHPLQDRPDLGVCSRRALGDVLYAGHRGRAVVDLCSTNHQRGTAAPDYIPVVQARTNPRCHSPWPQPGQGDYSLRRAGTHSETATVVQASVNAGSSAWLTPHGAHRSRGTKIFRHRPAARTYRRYPGQNTSGPAHDGQPGRGKPTSRPAATYASTASGHGHTMATGDTASDPFSRSAQHEARRDPSRSTGTPRS